MTTPKQTKPPSAADNVIALASFRDRVARARRPARADALFDSPDPEAAIRALPPPEFFRIIQQLGFPEAMDVLVHGTAEQVQAVLDFTVWDHDHVAMDKADDWLAALVEAPVRRLGQWAEGIDVELLALLVRQRARIYDLSLEEAPDELEGTLWETPDRCFAIDLRGEPDQVRVTQHLLDSLYRYSPNMMRRLLVGLRAESDAELEETAYRWRCGRMADLGFPDWEQAMAAYQELDPATVTLPADAGPAPRARDDSSAEPLPPLPAVISERLSGRTPLARAVAGLASAEEAGEAHNALVLLANRVLSANRVDPGDDDAGREALEALSATLDLAVEFLARGSLEREVMAVRHVPFLTLHRLGVSVIGKLGRLALALVRKNPFAKLRPAIDIFEIEDSDVLASLAKMRPAFPRVLDLPPAPGERPFASLADLAMATRAVERAAAAVQLITALGVRPADLTPDGPAMLAKTTGEASHDAVDPDTIDTGTLARTVLVSRLLGLPGDRLTVLDDDAVLKFKRRFNSGPQLPEEARLEASAVLCKASGTTPLEGARREVAMRWLDTLCPLGAVLRGGPSTRP